MGGRMTPGGLVAFGVLVFWCAAVAARADVKVQARLEPRGIRVGGTSALEVDVLGKYVARLLETRALMETR